MQSTFKNVIIVLCVVSVCFFSGCQKKDPPSTKSKTQLITQAPWKFSQAGIDQNNDGVIDISLPPGILLACATDNLFLFKEDLSGVIDEGPTKCSATSPQMSPFMWKFLNNETEIDFSTPIIAGIGGTAKIVELSETKFTLSKTVSVKEFPFPLPIVAVLVH